MTSIEFKDVLAHQDCCKEIEDLVCALLWKIYIYQSKPTVLPSQELLTCQGEWARFSLFTYYMSARTVMTHRYVKPEGVKFFIELYRQSVATLENYFTIPPALNIFSVEPPKSVQFDVTQLPPPPASTSMPPPTPLTSLTPLTPPGSPLAVETASLNTVQCQSFPNPPYPCVQGPPIHVQGQPNPVFISGPPMMVYTPIHYQSAQTVTNTNTVRVPSKPRVQVPPRIFQTFKPRVRFPTK